MTKVKLDQLTYFSMFSGVGGFELGIERAVQNNVCLQRSKYKTKNTKRQNGSRLEREWPTRLGCVGFSEIDKYAVRIYLNHFPAHKEYGNATTINYSTVPNFSLLVAGFPCQAFSIAGKRDGFFDVRGTLFFEIARCASEKRPRLLLLENVKGLLSHDKGQTFAIILATLDELGYDAQWQVLNSKNFGVPQNRERVFIVGHLRGTRRPEVFPIKSINAEAAWGTLKPSQGQTRSMSSCYAQEMETMRIRRLTPTECERLQGFPDNWTVGISDTQRYKCLGNAVTVNVITAIMKKLL